MKTISILFSGICFVLLGACDEIASSPIVNTVTNNPSTERPLMDDAHHAKIKQTAFERRRELNPHRQIRQHIVYLESHLGRERAYILDDKTSILVSLPGHSIFNESGTRLSKNGRDAVKRIGASLIEFPLSRVTIAGHVSLGRYKERDILLSERKGQAVKGALMSLGIDACRIGVTGFGSDDPVAYPHWRRSDQYNDRIEILIIPTRNIECL